MFIEDKNISQIEDELYLTKDKIRVCWKKIFQGVIFKKQWKKKKQN